MKINPALTDFPATMIAACEAALDAGIFYTDAFEDFAIAHMGGLGCEPVLMEVAELDDTAPDSFANQLALLKRLEEAVVAAPRGHYAVWLTRSKAGEYFRTVASDGYGDKPAVGGSFDTFSQFPRAESVIKRMVGYEIYLCRKAIEHARLQERSRQVLHQHGIRVGTTVRDLAIAGERFSTAIVQEVTPETGTVKLLLTRRGTKARWHANLSAQELVERSSLGQSTPSDQHSGVLF